MTKTLTPFDSSFGFAQDDIAQGDKAQDEIAQDDICQQEPTKNQKVFSITNFMKLLIADTFKHVTLVSKT